MAAEDIERVPTRKRRTEGMLSSGVATEVDDIREDIDPLIFGEALKLFDDDVGEDNFGVIVRKAAAPSHIRFAAARSRTRAGSMFSFAHTSSSGNRLEIGMETDRESVE